MRAAMIAMGYTRSEPLAGHTMSRTSSDRSKRVSVEAEVIPVDGNHWICIVRDSRQPPNIDNPLYYIVDTSSTSVSEFHALIDKNMDKLAYYVFSDKFRIEPMFVPHQISNWECGYLCLFWIAVIRAALMNSDSNARLDLSGYRYIYTKQVLTAYFWDKYIVDYKQKYEDIQNHVGITITSDWGLTHWIQKIIEPIHIDSVPRESGYFQIYKGVANFVTTISD